MKWIGLNSYVDKVIIIYNSMAQSEQRQKKIGNYILGKTIGEGTFGKVKLGTHTLTGEKVAIKILVKQKIIDVADVQRVSREIHILKLIRHPSIIQLYQIIQTSKHLFLIMQYVENGELFDYIVTYSKIDQLQACRFFKNIISGISYLHQLNIVHRDLKPENLLIDWKQGIKIVDFGLSNTYKPGEMLKTACGSPCYAAPQMISNKKYNGLDVDIWSCGVIVFAMVCGYLPFQDSNTSQLYKKILSGEYLLPDFVSKQFQDLLGKILNTDASKRIKIKQIYSHQWCQLVQDIPLNSGIIVGYHRIPVDKQILTKLKQFNFDIEYAQRCIQANKHNHITTTYYLLLKKFLKIGYKSNADISSPNFDYSSIQPFKRPQNLRKPLFFTNQEDINIEIQTKDIRALTRNNEVVNDRRVRFQSYNQSSNQLERQKNNNNLNSSSIFQGGRKNNDLKMYLQSTSKRKQFYSQIKRRQERRNHAQSLHFDLKSSQKEKSIRMNTQYIESSYKRPVRSKMQKYKNLTRFANKQLKYKVL